MFPFKNRVLGFLGIGTINSSIVQGLCTSPGITNRILLGPRNVHKSNKLCRMYPNHTQLVKTNAEIVEQSDWIFVATPPGPTETQRCLKNLPFRSDQTIISINAGVTQKILQELCSPATDIVQALPLPPAAQHQSTTVLTPKHPQVEELFSLLGEVIAVPENAEMMKLGTLACVMGHFDATQRAIHQWMVEQGVESGLAAHAIASYSQTYNQASLRVGKEGFDSLLEEQTPGGMNELVVRELTERGDYDHLKKALDNLLARLVPVS